MSSHQTATLPKPLVEALRAPLDGGSTTIRVARFARDNWALRVSHLSPMRRLAEWSRDGGPEHSLIGGFYVRADATPLGDLHVGGRALGSVPFDPPWGRVRACVHTLDGDVRLRSRLELPPHPDGDLLQAGPMLLRGGISLVEGGADPEGFSAGASQFDSDITDGRHPRAALGVSASELIAVVSEGRAEGEAGLTLEELAGVMADLGAVDAINLDGGGSASLVVGGRLLNTPREQHGVEIPGGRLVPTALAFIAR